VDTGDYKKNRRVPA